MTDSTRTARLPIAAEWCGSRDPLLRIKGLELAGECGREGRELVFRGLVDPDTLVKETAVRAAARTVSAARLLSGVASEENSALRTACLEALKQKGPSSLPALRRRLLSKDTDVVMFCLEVLGSMPEKDALPLLLPYVADGNLNVAQAAVESLGRLKSPGAVKPLLGLLSGDVWLSLSAVLALGEIGDRQATESLLGLLDDETLLVPALEALERIGDPEAVGPLLQRFARTDARSWEALVKALSSCLGPERERAGRDIETGLSAVLAGEDIERFLRGALLSSELPLRSAAGRVVRTFGCRTLYPALIEHLDEEPNDAPTVPFLAALPAAEGAESILRAAATHERAGVRGAAMRILGLRSEKWGDPLVGDRLSDSDASVVGQAIRALARRRPPGCFLTALPLLLRPEESVSTRALEALPTMARAEDLGHLAGLIATTPHGEALQAYVELSRRLEGSRFVDAWLARLPGAPHELLRLLVRALGSAPGPRVRDALVNLLEHPSPSIRALVIEVLAQPENSDLGPELHRRFLADPSCRYALVRALGRLRFTAAADDLIAFYPAASAMEKIATLDALGALETPAAGRFLRSELGSYDRERRRAAAMALGRHFQDGNLSLFLRLARSKDWSLRNTAAQALGGIGGAEARTALRRLSGDVQEVVARTARVALQRCP